MDSSPYIFEQDAFGIALSSPGLCSPGLMGDQGWSPCSSTHSFCDNTYAEEQAPTQRRACSKSASKDSRRHTWAWPMPPVRIPATRPLSFGNKSRASSVSSPRLAMDRDGSSTGSVSGKSESSAITLPDGVSLPFSLSPRRAMTDRFNQQKRHVSAPGPTMFLDSIFDQEMDVVEIVDDRMFDESLPLMPTDLSRRPSGWEDEEKVKMDRLHASFSLLGVESGPRAGHYSSSSSLSANSTPTSGSSNSPREVEDGHSPTAGLCLLHMALSPEHKAPTLAEQMAFASGLGNLCSWASPMKQTYASSDDYLRVLQRQQENFYLSPESEHLFSDEDNLPVSDQEDRKHASRHIRQQVAASAALSRSMDSYRQPFEYEDSSRRNSTESYTDEEYYSSESPEETLRRENFMKASANSGQSIGFHSAISASSSPILHGALSATTFDSVTVASSTVASSSTGSQVSDIASPSTCPSSLPESMSTTPTMVKGSHVNTVSPILADEFAYLAHNDAFLASRLPDGYSVMHTAAKSHWPDANGFNGNTLSPCLTTPELGMTDIPSPLALVPSPCMELSSVEPMHDNFDDSRDETFRLELPMSQSTTSILERPRPIPSSSSSSFFAQCDVVHQRIMASRMKRASIVSQKASIELSSDALEKQEGEDGDESIGQISFDASRPSIPNRKASLEMGVLLSPSKMGPSISFKDEPHPRNLVQNFVVKNEHPGMRSSMSTGSLGPKALSQVREACRLKAKYLRNGQWVTENAPPVPRVPKELKVRPDLKTASSEPIKSFPQAVLPSNTMTPKPIKMMNGSPIKQMPKSASTNNVEQVRMPTLFVARTPSQRKRGQTGIPATEPSNLAMAKLGFKVDTPTRFSTVRALSGQQSHPLRKQGLSSMDISTDSMEPYLAMQHENNGSANSSTTSLLDHDLQVAAELQNSVQGGMPKGFVLVVEEKQTFVSNLLVA